jgi:uncharacterized membrane protein
MTQRILIMAPSEIMTKVGLYWLHERVWSQIS